MRKRMRILVLAGVLVFSQAGGAVVLASDLSVGETKTVEAASARSVTVSAPEITIGSDAYETAKFSLSSADGSADISVKGFKVTAEGKEWIENQDYTLFFSGGESYNPLEAFFVPLIANDGTTERKIKIEMDTTGSGVYDASVTVIQQAGGGQEESIITGVTEQSKKTTSDGTTVVYKVTGTNLDKTSVKVKEGMYGIDESKYTVEVEGSGTEQTITVFFVPNIEEADASYTVHFYPTSSTSGSGEKTMDITIPQAGSVVEEQALEEVTVDQASLPSKGGTVVFTLKGSGLTEKTLVKVTDKWYSPVGIETLHKQVSGAGNEQKITLTFPENTDEDYDKVYKVSFYADGDELNFDENNKKDAPDITVAKKGEEAEAEPTLTGAVADKSEVTNEDRKVTFTLTGTDLTDKTAVKVTDGQMIAVTEQITDIQVSGTGKSQTVSMTLPENKGEKDETYKVFFYADGNMGNSADGNRVSAGVTVRADEQKEPEAEAEVTSITANPVKIGSAGGDVQLTVIGKGLTEDNWGVEVSAYLYGMEWPMATKVTEITKNGATLSIPENTMKNEIEYRIIAGAKQDGEIKNQASAVVTQAPKADNVTVNPKSVEMPDGNTIIVTFDEKVTAAESAEELKRKIFVADYGNENGNKYVLGSEDIVTVDGTTVTITLKEALNLNVEAAIYIKEGALKNADGKNLRDISYIISAQPRVNKIVLDKTVLDSQGGTVKATLKGIRLEELKAEGDITGKVMYAGTSRPTDIEVDTTYGEAPVLTFDVPKNTTEATQTYLLKVYVKGIPVVEGISGEPAERAAVSVLPADKTAEDQTLSAMTISANTEAGTDGDLSNVEVTVTPQIGGLKVVLHLYGTNLDSSVTKLRAIDENGIIWPVYNIAECDGTFRFTAIAYEHGNGATGDGNSQIIEVLPPRYAGTNKEYKIQVAIDGKNYLDVPTVGLKVWNEGITGEADFTSCGPEDIRTVKVHYVEQGTGKKLAESDEYKGYSISMIQGFGIAPKEIEGYELVKSPAIDPSNDYVLNGREYSYEYKKIDSETPGGDDQKPGGDDQKPGGDDQKPGGDDQKPGGDDQKPGGDSQTTGGNGQASNGNGENAGGTASGNATQVSTGGQTAKAARTGDPTSVIPCLSGMALAVGALIARRKKK